MSTFGGEKSASFRIRIVATSILFTRSSTIRLFPISKYEIMSRRKKTGSDGKVFAEMKTHFEGLEQSYISDWTQKKEKR